MIEHPSIEIDKMTAERGTALHLACQKNFIAIVILLIENGA